MNVSDTAAALTESLVESAQIREALQGEKAQEAVQKLVVGWLLNCPNKNEDILRRRLTMIAATGLEQALPLALAIAGGDPQYLHVQPLAKAEAALIVGQLGKREHIDQAGTDARGHDRLPAVAHAGAGSAGAHRASERCGAGRHAAADRTKRRPITAI